VELIRREIERKYGGLVDIEIEEDDEEDDEEAAGDVEEAGEASSHGIPVVTTLDSVPDSSAATSAPAHEIRSDSEAIQIPEGHDGAENQTTGIEKANDSSPVENAGENIVITTEKTESNPVNDENEIIPTVTEPKTTTIDDNHDSAETKHNDDQPSVMKEKDLPTSETTVQEFPLADHRSEERRLENQPLSKYTPEPAAPKPAAQEPVEQVTRETTMNEKEKQVEEQKRKKTKLVKKQIKINAVLIDYLLYDIAKEREKEQQASTSDSDTAAAAATTGGEIKIDGRRGGGGGGGGAGREGMDISTQALKLPHHRTRSIWY
jgi:hypothetical protein